MLNDGIIPAKSADCSATRLRGYCAVPSAPDVGVGEALSPVSGNGEKEGDSEPAGVTEGAAKVSAVAGTDAAGIGPGT